MTRAELGTAVRTYLDVDGKRRGSETLVEAAINAACRDLAFYVPQFRGADPAYASGDQVPFTIESAEAIAEYVKERIARQVFRDIGLAKDHNAQYRTLRRRLYLASHEPDVFEIREGDIYPPFEVTLRDDDGPIDLATAIQVQIVVKLIGSTHEYLRADMEILSPRSNGKVQRNWEAGDTVTPGKYRAIFEVNPGASSLDADGNPIILTYPAVQAAYFTIVPR